MDSFKQWCIDQHTKTNHFYGEGDYIPYRFHLEMVVREVETHFKNKKIGDKDSYITDMGVVVPKQTLISAAWGHDVIERHPSYYNEVKKACSPDFQVAEIIYACTNEKGRNRKERANDKYYEAIRKTDGASFLKVCDRVANVKYSKMMGSAMFEMYRKENDGFMEKIWLPELEQFGFRETLTSLFS